LQAPPPAARIIDGTGKTLLPGLWEMHQHYYDDIRGPLLLAQGITSARDPGNSNARTLDRARRRAAGLLLAPHVYPSSLLDGISPTTSQLGTVVGSQDEAIAAVRRAKTDGFTGIKIYSSFNPAWVAATAAEAHRLGLHVHGHVPAGMRPLDAINDGYDEITHINFVIMQAMPDDVVDHSNTSARMTGIGRYAATVDLNSEPMKSLIATMASRHITVDPTLIVFESELVPEQGDLSPAYAPFVGTLPPNDERGFRAGGTAVPPGSSRAQFRASFAKLQALVGLLHAKGVRLVAGTDGSGIELVHELELYVAAGLSPADALEAATLDAARTVGVESHTGSIKVGKDADLVLVDGDPEANIGDLRHTRMVMLGGRMMDADALRKEAGFSGPPK
jgi:imidazolonepropionase-like amidohydrolase